MQISPPQHNLAQASGDQRRMEVQPRRTGNIQAQAAPVKDQNTISGNQLALYKRPRPDLVIPQLDNTNSMGTMTRRFEALYDRQVEKGRNVDVRV